MRISGNLRFPAGQHSVEFERVWVSVRDISRMDAPAETVARVDLGPLKVPPGGIELPFSLEADVADPHKTFVLRAHADRTGSGAVEPGDYVTDTAHPVGPDQPPSAVLELRPVGR